jgi:hypothetical protein
MRGSIYLYVVVNVIYLDLTITSIYFFRKV